MALSHLYDSLQVGVEQCSRHMELRTVKRHTRIALPLLLLPCSINIKRPYRAQPSNF